MQPPSVHPAFTQHHFSTSINLLLQKISLFLRRRSGAGFTIIDSVLALFIVATMVLLFGSLISARDINRRSLQRAQAAALADEEINALRRLGYVNLANQTNGAFKNVLHNAGTWTVAAGGVTGNALELGRNTNISNAVSGRLLFPAGVYQTPTLQAAWKAATDSPSGWAIGYLFHARDKDNGYRLRVAATATDLDASAIGTQNLLLESLTNGTAAKIFSKAVTINLNTWYTLKLILGTAPNPTVKIYIDGNQQDTGNITDATYTSGMAALLGWGGVHAYVDDAQTVTGATDSWDFNTGTTLPAAWIRFGLNDLPDSTLNAFDDNGRLTIESYPNVNAQNLKRVTVRIEWRHQSTNLSYTSTVLVGKSELGL